MPIWQWSRRFPLEQEFVDALERQNAEKVRNILKQRGAPVDIWFTPKDKTGSSGRPTSVEYTGVLWAAQHNNLELLSALIEAGAKVNVQLQGRDAEYPYTALHIACVHGYAAIAKALMDAGADANVGVAKARSSFGALLGSGSSSHAPLHIACRNGHLAVLKVLLQHPAIDVNKSSGVRGLRPIHYAIQSRNLQVLSALLSKKPDLEQPVLSPSSPYPLTALQYALSHFIPADGSDDDLSDSCTSLSDTPSCKCSPRRSSSPTSSTSRLPCPASVLSDIMDLLLQHGANRDIRDAAGNTLLHQAVTLGCSRLVDVLLRHGTPTSAINHLGKSAWIVALEYKNDKVISLMAQYRRAVGRLSLSMHSSRGSLVSDSGACETNIESITTPRGTAMQMDTQVDDSSSGSFSSERPVAPCPHPCVTVDANGNRGTVKVYTC